MDFKLKLYGDRVYYDTTLGVAGTLWPIGTATHPSNSLANIRTICVRENIHTIVVHGLLTLDAAMDDYDFIGNTRVSGMWISLADHIDLNGQSIDSSTFRDLCIASAQAGVDYAVFYNCAIEATNLHGYFFDCFLLSMGLGVACRFYNCSSWENAWIDANGQSLNIYDWVGDLTLSNVNAGGQIVRIFAKDSSTITLAATCTAGDIYIYGDVILTVDPVATSVVHNHSTRGAVRTGTFTLLAGVAEQDCLEFLAAADISKQQIDVELDMSALAQTNTVREKVMVDGVNYQQISAKVFPTVFDAGTTCVILSFVQKGSSYKITLQASVTEGIDMDILYRYMVRDLS